MTDLSPDELTTLRLLGVACGPVKDRGITTKTHKVDNAAARLLAERGYVTIDKRRDRIAYNLTTDGWAAYRQTY